MNIPFNEPYITGKEIEYIKEVIAAGKTSGDGSFTKKCHEFFEKSMGFNKVLLTASCTDALEMTALLAEVQPGDEVIIPAYTFVSTVNAFVLRGAKIVFADSLSDSPNINPEEITKLITSKTKAIVVMHYAGIACNMDAIMNIANSRGIPVIEDAALALGSKYKGRNLGAIGCLGTFSFHETKNIISGEGGLLVINDNSLLKRAEIIREKGTNRSAFFRGEVDKYNWVDVGSSFLPSELNAAFLLAQLGEFDKIQKKRIALWKQYFDALLLLDAEGKISLPKFGAESEINGHLFYMVCKNLAERTALIKFLKESGVTSVFHYISLYKSPYFASKHDGHALPNSDKFSDCLLRLPLYYDLSEEEVNYVAGKVKEFYSKY